LKTLTTTLAALPRQTGIAKDLRAQMVLTLSFIALHFCET